MKPNQKIIMAVAFLCLLTSAAVAQTARDIMVKVDKVARESASSSFQKTKLSTCRYGITGKKMRCVETPRVKVMESISKNTGKDGKDTRSVAIILEPIGEKGIGMLSYDYDDPDKDTDTWLYLSALGKVKRMISSSEDSDESGSFFGTEFAIEDVEANKIDDYTYKILKEGTYAKRPVWMVESVPTAKRARKTRYGKAISWIDKERYLVIKANLFNRHLKPYKQLVMRHVEKIDGVWTAKNLTMNNLITKRVTTMELIAVAFNMEIPDNFLSQRTLTDFAFREHELAKLRKFIE